MHDYKKFLKILEKKNLQQKLNELVKKYNSKNIILYGADTFFDVINENFNLKGLNIIGISDEKFFNSKNETYKGIKIIKPDEIASYKPDLVLITTYQLRMVKQYFEEVLFKNAPTFKYEFLVEKLFNDFVYKFDYENNTIKFYLPDMTDEIIQRFIFENDTFYENDLLSTMKKYINSNSVVLDAGTNMGNHTLFFSKICNAKKLISFEPNNDVFQIFEKNIELNNIKNIEKHNLALGEKEGYAQICYTHERCNGSTQFAFTDSGDFKVISLDSLNIEQLDFCKVDVEGAQLEFLRGAKNTLKKHKPTIWIELLDEKSAVFNYSKEKEVILPQKLLNELGYVLVEKMTDYDYLYIHKEKIQNGI